MSIPKITEENVKNWFDAGSFSRGKSYYRNGRILQPKVQGTILKSQCTGSSYAAYRVQVTLSERGNTISTNCSCPLGGACKHCVALLLQWIHEPDSFNHVEEISKVLSERSKDDLIKLIELMMDKHPDLESLIELSTLTSATTDTPINPDVIRRQVQAAIDAGDSYGYEYDDYYGSLDLSGLDVFDNIIEEYFQSKQWFNAATVSMTIIDSLLDNYDELYDEDGTVGDYVNEAVDYLEIAIANLEDPKERETVFRALFDVEVWDIDYGGIDMGYRSTEIMYNAASPEEKAKMAEWTRKELASLTDESYSTEFKRKSYGGMLLQLEEDSLDDETYLRICRESGRTEELIDRLLSLKRVDEAVEAAAKVKNYNLLHIADNFVAHGAEEAITPIVQQRATNEGRNASYSNWLKDRALEKGDTATALTILQSIFDASPSLVSYQNLLDVAKQRAEESALREKILAQLQQDKNYALLTQIHIDEKNIDDALRTVDLISDSRATMWNAYSMMNGPSRLKLQIAEVAAETHPEASIRFYLEAAERLIDARGRDNYQQAATHLAKVKQIYRQQEREDEWLELVQQIRRQNSNLRAMQDEFNQAGLEK